MTQQQLMIFLRVHKTRSFAKAAQQLGIAQSTVSREIALLEREFQAPLFIRHSTGITPTPAGTALSTHATSFRDLYPKMLEDCRRIDAGLMPSLSLGTNSSGAVIMQPVLDRIVREHPDIPLSLQNAKFYYLLRMLNTGDVDAGVLLAGAADLEPQLVQHPLCSPRWFVAARKDHPYWDMSASDRSVLRDQMVIVNAEYISNVNTETLEITSRYCVDNGLPYRQFLRANFHQDVELMVGAGMGVALLPSVMASVLPPEIRLSDELAVPYAPQFVLVHRPDINHPGIRLLCSMCEDQFGGHYYG